MPLEILTVACLKDNYAYLLHDEASGRTACIDVPEAAPLLAALKARNWRLSDILLTHHHWDHIDGVADLVAATGAEVWGAKADAHRLPNLDHAFDAPSTFDFSGHTVEVIDTPGHTVGHVAFHIPSAGAVFTADSLMAFGCGRLFEGTPEQMWGALSRLAALPDQTLVYSGHEYTQSNARFALTIEPSNPTLVARADEVDKARAENRPTVPVALSLERETNPFLRAHLPQLKASLGMAEAPDAAVFAHIRARKDAF